MNKSDNVNNWQDRAYPVMVGIIFFLTIFFVFASTLFMYKVSKSILKESQTPRIETNDVDNKYFFELEYYIVKKRYELHSTTFAVSLWTRYMGYITGMIMCFIGSIFILGKIRESKSEINLQAENLNLALISSSPGLILSVLGTILIIYSINTRATVKTENEKPYILPFNLKQNQKIKDYEDTSNYENLNLDGVGEE